MRRRLGIVGLALVVAPNVLAWHHARAMLVFADEGARTPPPEKLGRLGKLRTVLFGVTIPRPSARAVPADYGLVAREHVVDGPIGPLSVLETGAGDRVVLLMHGYAGERSETFRTARRLVDLGYRVVMPNLRGTGTSAGRGTTLGWGEAEDARAVARWIGDELRDPAPVLYGFSMGGAAAIGAVGRLATPASAVVAEATFDRLVHTVGHRFRSMGLPARPLADLLLFWGGVQTGLNPWRVAPADDARRIGVPTLVVAGTVDPRVRPDESRALATALGEHGRLALIDGLGHGQLAIARPDTWTEVVAPFLVETAPPGG